MTAIEIQNINDVFHVIPQWVIENCVFIKEKGKLHAFAEVRKHSAFTCSNCGSKKMDL